MRYVSTQKKNTKKQKHPAEVKALQSPGKKKKSMQGRCHFHPPILSFIYIRKKNFQGSSELDYFKDARRSLCICCSRARASNTNPTKDGCRSRPGIDENAQFRSLLVILSAINEIRGSIPPWARPYWNMHLWFSQWAWDECLPDAVIAAEEKSRNHCALFVPRDVRYQGMSVGNLHSIHTAV